ncbi:MAG: hypothetical protein ACRD2W_21970 [Acidimicrobiales bacterium]
MIARRWVLGAAGTVGIVVGAAATAFACVSGPAINLSTTNAKPGQEVTIKGTNFRQADPVTVRWNALDGPVLATLDKPQSGVVTGTFTVPADAKAGHYVVILSQSKPDGKLSQLPIRALLTVTPEGSAPPVLGSGIATNQAERPVGLQTADNSVSGATLALVALGVAGVGMFVAGMAALFAGRRGQAPAAAAVRK